MENLKLNKIRFFVVGNLSEINEILAWSKNEKENIGADDFNSVDQIISITPNITDSRFYYVVYKIWKDYFVKRQSENWIV